MPLDLAAIQAAWPAFESGFDSLHGRRMMGLIDNRAGTYRLCTERLPRDMESSLGLDETTVPGGRYLRLKLIGDPPGVYGQIAAAFDELFEHADHDSTRRSSSSIDAKAKSTASSQSLRPCLSPERSWRIKATQSPTRSAGSVRRHAGVGQHLGMSPERGGCHPAQERRSQYEGRSRRDGSNRAYTCLKSDVSSSTLAP